VSAALCKKESNLLLVWITVCMCSSSKNAGEFFGLRLVSIEFQHLAIQTKIEQRFGGFFLQIKVCQPIGTGFYANRDLNKQEVGFIFA
jgi:hypothetical protein